MALAYAIDQPPDRPAAELVELLGSKGAGLAELAALGLPTPPGFTLTTEAVRELRAGGWAPALAAALDEHLGALEAATGRRLGAGPDPLLVSVRSGAAASLPGMLDTVLDVACTPAAAAALAAASGDEGFARDTRSRALASWAAVVGGAPPADPRDQVREAVAAVAASWDGPRARAYRDRAGLPHHGATAVTVQAMVFGNRGPASASGVATSRHPATGAPGPVGDVLVRAQGDDVVGGTRAPLPLAALAELAPAAHAGLLGALARLEAHRRDLVEVELTVEEGVLWLLQVRAGGRSARAAVRLAVDLATQPGWRIGRDEAVTRVTPAQVAEVLAGQGAGTGPGWRVVATGVAASPGAAVGRVRLSPEAAVAAAGRGEDVVLVRPETAPGDVAGLRVARAVLTARGGLASHAAVVARAWGIPAVVGAAAVEVAADHVVVGGEVVREGDLVSVDGSTGEVAVGAAPLATAEPPPELATLLAWADDVRRTAGDTADLPAPDRLARAQALLT